MSDAYLSNSKTILVTGCTSGIGLDVCKYLDDLNYSLLLVGRDEKKLKELSNELKDVVYYICDLEYIEFIVGLSDYCIKQGIKLDGMVHSAGYVVNQPIHRFNFDDMKKQMQVHYYAFLELCKLFCNRKISNKSASIVAISSMASLTKRKGSVLYASSKNAVNTAVSVASKEFAKNKTRVNAILPAYVDTRMTENLSDFIDIKNIQPMGLIPTRDVAYLAEYLLSEKSKYITGALIPISAGMED